MTAVDPELVAACRAVIATCSARPVATRVTGAGRTLATIAEAHVPLLVDYTREDREAKGLRRLVPRETAAPPVPDTVLEAAGEAPLLLLTGPSGCGKSTTLRHLALTLAHQRIAEAGSPARAPAAASAEVVRNETGEGVAERWAGPAVTPVRTDVTGPATLVELLETLGPLGRRIVDRSLRAPLLWTIDAAERLGPGGSRVLADAAALVAGLPGLRIVVAAEADAAHAWSVPPSFARRRIVALIEPQRRALAARLRPGMGPEAWRGAAADLLGHAGFFALALAAAAPFPATAAAAVDCWLQDAAQRNGLPVDTLIALGAAAFDGREATPEPTGACGGAPPTSAAAFDGREAMPEPIGACGGASPTSAAAFDGEAMPAAPVADAADRETLARPFVQRELAARRLARLSPAALAARHAVDPLKWSGPVGTAARRRVQREPGTLDAILLALVGTDTPDGADDDAARDLGAVTAATLLAEPASGSAGAASRSAVTARLCAIVAEGRLSTALRGQAGRALARDGDPRDLEALVDIPAGAFRMGSSTPGNSAPEHTVVLARPYRIGRYPVTNALYAAFVEATGRIWRSADGRVAERRNAPAGDLTWHDARACCDWLTERWRAAGRIDAREGVRLPTEAEWERAARGVRGGDAPVFPWLGEWQPDRANAEEAGFNDTCSVGLFPLGRSPDGCDDMAGQVWEWTSTLWGEDMATPHFRYPYRPDDGREAPTAAPALRRVLRGASFLSPREKANCTYRGSLEPDGFWRGNGFRVVVAAA